MPNYANEGDKVRMKDGTIAVVKGGRLVAVPGATQAAPAKMSPQAQKFLNELSERANSARETQLTAERAEQAVDRLKPGPFRGRFLDIAIPDEKGGFFDTLGAGLVGLPSRVTGIVDQQEVDDYQTLRGLQSEQVLERQIAQKGPQTESDAARLMLTEISPSKSPEVNKKIIAAATEKTKRAQARAVFYTQWANKYGLNGVNERGRTADQVWAGWQDEVVKRLFGEGEGSTPTVRLKRKQ